MAEPTLPNPDGLLLMQFPSYILDAFHPVELQMSNLWQDDEFKPFQEIPHKLWILLLGVDLFDPPRIY